MFWLNRYLYGSYKGMLIRIQWKPLSRYMLDVFILFSKRPAAQLHDASPFIGPPKQENDSYDSITFTDVC